MKTTLEKTLDIAYTLSNDSGKFGYFTEMMVGIYGKDDDFQVIKTKMDNLVEKLNSLKGDELTDYLNKDFETEIWDEI